MTKRFHMDLADEYHFLKEKVAKLYLKIMQIEGQVIKEKRLIKKGRSFIQRMLEIEQDCKNYGYPHPDTKYYESETPSNYDLTNLRYNQKALYNPDGTLFKTPVLEGSDLRLYSEEEKEKFFSKDGE